MYFEVKLVGYDSEREMRLRNGVIARFEKNGCSGQVTIPDFKQWCGEECDAVCDEFWMLDTATLPDWLVLGLPGGQEVTGDMEQAQVVISTRGAVLLADMMTTITDSFSDQLFPKAWMVRYELEEGENVMVAEMQSAPEESYRSEYLPQVPAEAPDAIEVLKHNFLKSTREDSVRAPERELEAEKDTADKFDDGKMRLGLIPSEALAALGVILTYGVGEYSARNWEKGMDWEKVYSAALGHMLSFWSGEDFDEESGYPHLWHALTEIAFLVAYQERGIGTDSRPPNEKFFHRNIDDWVEGL